MYLYGTMYNMGSWAIRSAVNTTSLQFNAVVYQKAKFSLALTDKMQVNNSTNLEVWYEALTQGTQQLEQQVDVIRMMAEEVQQYLDDKFRFLPMLVIHTVHLPVELLLDKHICGPVHI
jgi:hypothetical protein